MQKITDIIMYCPGCDWTGTLGDCELGESSGDFQCPECLALCAQLPDQQFKYN